MNAEQRPKIRLLGGVRCTKEAAALRIISNTNYNARERVFKHHTPVTHICQESRLKW